MELPEGIAVHFTAGLSAGLAATILGSPADVVGTRLMAQVMGLIAPCLVLNDAASESQWLSQLLQPCMHERRASCLGLNSPLSTTKQPPGDRITDPSGCGWPI